MIKIPAYRGTRIGVLGLGLSGLSTARALLASGADVVAWDDRPDICAKAEEAGIEVAHPSEWDWSAIARLVASPGVPLAGAKAHPAIAMARKADTPVIGDVELFHEAVAAQPPAERPKVIAVTGSNGKSTTTALIGHLLKTAGLDAQVGGNIGEPVLNLAALERSKIYVLELSSFQLDLTHAFHADVAILLNLSPDHLDRHGDMAAYAAAKRKIFANQSSDDTAVIGVDDSWCEAICTEIVAVNGRSVIPVSGESALGRGVFAPGGGLTYNLDGVSYAAADLADAPALRGMHNWQNAAAAFAAAHALLRDAERAARGLTTFPGLAHRQQTVAQKGRVQFVNDSKATNPEAAARALAAYEDVFWLAGGRAKEGGFDALAPALGAVRKAFLFGESADVIARTLEGQAEYELFEAMPEALRAAAAAAGRSRTEAPVVLLSPACASFDQYKNFEARGEAFAHLACELADTNGAAA